MALIDEGVDVFDEGEGGGSGSSPPTAPSGQGETVIPPLQPRQVDTTSTTSTSSTTTPPPADDAGDGEQVPHIPTASITKTYTIRRKEIRYYYLGWVMEAIRYSLKKLRNVDINFVYGDIDPAMQQLNAIYETAINSLQQESTDQQTPGNVLYKTAKINNVFQIPIPATTVEELFSNLNANQSTTEVISTLISNFNLGTLENINLQTSNKPNSNTIQIDLYSITNQGGIEVVSKTLLQQEVSITQGNFQNIMIIDYQTRLSLIESVDISAKLDPSVFAVYTMPSPMRNGKLIDLYEEYIKSNPKLDKDFKNYLSANADNQSLFNKAGESTVLSNKNNVVTQFAGVYGDDTLLRLLTSGATTFDQNFAYFLKRITVTIHGITGLSLGNYIHIRGLAVNLSGTYAALSINEKIDVNNFTTTIEATYIDGPT